MYVQTIFGPLTTVCDAKDGVDVAELVAVAARKNTAFDAVFLDCMMPIMNGPSAAKSLQAAGFRGQIVGMSTVSSADSRESFAAAGVHLLLDKPATEAALMTSIVPCES